MFSITTTSTGAQPDQQRDSENDDEDTSDRMQAESEEPSDLKVVKGTHDNVLRESFSTRRSSSGEGYIGDCSASEQASDQSVHCAASGQKQRSTMKLALNRLDLNFTSSEMESSSGQDGSSLTDEEMANTPMFDGIQARPQCKVARISHPMNPRIDISTVVHVQASVLALATTAASLPTATTMTVSNGATYTKGATGSTSITFVATASPTFDLPIMETYTQLLSPAVQLSDRPDEAQLQNLQESLRISLLNDGEFPCRVSIARIYKRIGHILSCRGDFVAAVEQYELALGVYPRAGKSEDSKEMTRLRRKIFDALV